MLFEGHWLSFLSSLRSNGVKRIVTNFSGPHYNQINESFKNIYLFFKIQSRILIYLLVWMYMYYNQYYTLVRASVCFIANFAYLLQYCITITRSYLIFADFGNVSNSFCRTIYYKDKHQRIYVFLFH